MSLAPLEIAENLFTTGTKDQVRQLISVLQTYLTKADPIRSIQIDKDEIAKKHREKRATAQEIYLVSPQSVCPCCRK